MKRRNAGLTGEEIMRKPGRVILITASLLLLGGRPVSSSASAGAAQPDGFIYGTVETEAGRRYTGVLRWGDEEAFWDDLFNGAKAKLPYIDRLPEDRRKRREIRILGLRVSYDWDDEATGRQFIARFGDLKEIRPHGGEEADVVMKSGKTYRLDDGSNDIGATLRIQDAEVGSVEVEWSRIERITFAAAPAGVRPEVLRLVGDVVTDDGTFHGFVQWDSQECLSTDKLDGNSEDGRLSLDMGRIRSISKEGSRGAEVEMRDGRKLDMRGTNDVDSSIRGIFVEDERFGRVKISWDAFRRAEFQEGAATGRAYADYKPATPLRGTVADRDGKSWKGKLIFDLDESESWEMLNGDRHGVEYNIPFEMVRSMEPVDDESSSVTLRNGRDLRLEKGQDVTRDNAGVLVLPEGGGAEHYVPWDRVRKIEFE
jgi:hypothetical protein